MEAAMEKKYQGTEVHHMMLKQFTIDLEKTTEGKSRFIIYWEWRTPRKLGQPLYVMEKLHITPESFSSFMETVLDTFSTGNLDSCKEQEADVEHSGTQHIERFMPDYSKKEFDVKGWKQRRGKTASADIQLDLKNDIS
jgi:hypothetical protein